MELVKNRLFLSPTIVGSGYRTKILEAGAIGMPVICTTFDFKPFADYLKPHEHILVADTEKEFFEILKNVENSPISLEKISQTFYLTLKEKFSWDDTAKKFVNLYSQLISNKKT
jgi:glycosyltransferase involved in cell wall biosynthesis